MKEKPNLKLKIRMTAFFAPFGFGGYFLNNYIIEKLSIFDRVFIAFGIPTEGALNWWQVAVGCIVGFTLILELAALLVFILYMAIKLACIIHWISKEEEELLVEDYIRNSVRFMSSNRKS